MFTFIGWSTDAYSESEVKVRWVSWNEESESEKEVQI